MTDFVGTIPKTIAVLSTDNPKTVGCLATPFLNSGETVTGLATQLMMGNAPTLTPGPVLADPPTFTSTTGAQKIRGQALTTGVQYTLRWIWTLSSGDVVTTVTFIYCPE